VLVDMVGFTLSQATKALRESRSTALLYFRPRTRRGEGSASRPGGTLRPGKTRYPLYRRLGGPQGRSGLVRKISPPPWCVGGYTDIKFSIDLSAFNFRSFQE